jgi:hypothetical protein
VVGCSVWAHGGVENWNCQFENESDVVDTAASGSIPSPRVSSLHLVGHIDYVSNLSRAKILALKKVLGAHSVHDLLV